MEGNLRLKIDWASLILGRKFTGGAYIWRGLFSEFTVFGNDFAVSY